MDLKRLEKEIIVEYAIEFGRWKKSENARSWIGYSDEDMLKEFLKTYKK